MADGIKIIGQNKKAYFNYTVDEKYECGIVLQGTEVKSVKQGSVSFADSFASGKSENDNINDSKHKEND